MNWEQLKRSVGTRVQLVPSPCRVDEQHRKLPLMDDDWMINEVSSDGLRISNVRTGHSTTLGKDHVHHFTSNHDRSKNGIRYGFLTLNVQVFLQGTKLWVRPNSRPGEAVEPESVKVIEKCVNLKYPFNSGIQARLQAAGYRVAWCLETNLAYKLDLEDWEIVIEPDAQGILTKFRLKDRPSDQILIKKRNR